MLFYLLIIKIAGDVSDQLIKSDELVTGEFYKNTEDCDEKNFIVKNCYFYDITIPSESNALIYINNAQTTINGKGAYCQIHFNFTTFDRCQGMISITHSKVNSWSELNCYKVYVRNCSSKTNEGNNTFCKHYGFSNIDLMTITTSEAKLSIMQFLRGHYDNNYPNGSVKNMNVSQTQSNIGIRNEYVFTDFLYNNYQNNSIEWQIIYFRNDPAIPAANKSVQHNISYSNFLANTFTNELGTGGFIYPVYILVRNVTAKIMNCYFDESTNNITLSNGESAKVILENCRFPANHQLPSENSGKYEISSESPISTTNEIEGLTWFATSPMRTASPARTWADGMCLNYMTEKKKSLKVKVVNSLGAAAALSESL